MSQYAASGVYIYYPLKTLTTAFFQINSMHNTNNKRGNTRASPSLFTSKTMLITPHSSSHTTAGVAVWRAVICAPGAH